VAQFSELRPVDWLAPAHRRKLRSMWRWLIVLAAGYALSAVAAPAWTWVDENGQRHFSDRPVPGATQIDLPDSQTFARRVARTSGDSQSQGAPETPQAPAAMPYTTFEIVSPSHQETLWNIGGNLTMQLAIQPALQSGHSLNAVLDGRVVPIGARGNQLTIPEVFRGLHQIQAVIVDSSGREVLRSLEITVMVQQTSILTPNSPGRANPAN
jgi:hypothetical protein